MYSGFIDLRRPEACMKQLSMAARLGWIWSTSHWLVHLSPGGGRLSSLTSGSRCCSTFSSLSWKMPISSVILARAVSRFMSLEDVWVAEVIKILN